MGEGKKYALRVNFDNRPSCEFSTKLPGKIEILTVQDDFCEIVDVVWRNICFLTV